MSGIPAEPEPPVISLPAIRDRASSASRPTLGQLIPGQVSCPEHAAAVGLGPAIAGQGGSLGCVDYFRLPKHLFGQILRESPDVHGGIPAASNAPLWASHPLPWSL